MFKRVLSKFLTPNSTETPVPREEYRSKPPHRVSILVNCVFHKDTEFSTPERTKTIFVDLGADFMTLNGAYIC